MSNIFNCQVCDAPSSGNHFGADVCRACSAFFRRSVSRSQEYKCKKNETCQILAAKMMCKKCRFAKCKRIGMRQDAVQKNRDIYGKREGTVTTLAIPMSSAAPSMPLLKKVSEMYRKLETQRTIVYGTRNRPRIVNYKQTIEVLLKEYHLISEWIFNAFTCYSSLPCDQKEVLLRNFFFQFVVLEAGFRACHHRRNDVWFIPSGDYIDCVDLATFFHDPDGTQTMSSKEAVKMFGSSFDTYHRNVSVPMIRENVDRIEFLVLATLTLFATGVDGQSDECYEVCREAQKVIQKELLHYYEFTKTIKEPPIRLGNILSIVPNLQRATRRFQVEIELRHVLKAYSVDRKFYETCLGKF